MEFFKNPNFKFMKVKYIAFLLSLTIIIAGGISVYVKKGFNLSIDFAGGTLVQINFKNDVSIDKVRKNLKNVDLGKSIIQKLGEGHEFIIKAQKVSSKSIEEENMEKPEEVANKIVEALRTPEEKALLKEGKLDLNISEKSFIKKLLLDITGDEQKAEEYATKISDYKKKNLGIIKDFNEIKNILPSDVFEKLKEKSFLGNMSLLRVEIVGPQVGKDLRYKATQATIWALIGMLIYIAFRFKFLFGVSAVLTLAHDVLVTLSFISFFNKEISLTVVAGILTIVGYSLNDTIVIYDRVRDNLKKYAKKLGIDEVLDISINETLSRTIITSGTTLLTVLALYIFGGEVIRDFAFTMLVGIISGTYSSIYQSCAYIGIWEKRKDKKMKEKKEANLRRIEERKKSETKKVKEEKTEPVKETEVKKVTQQQTKKRPSKKSRKKRKKR